MEQTSFNLAVKTAEPKIYSVSDLNQAIRKQLEGGFQLVWLKGEISNFKHHTSGHFYFCLKDKKSQINAVMFKGFNARLKFKLEDGLEVLVRGKVTVYEPRGNYQIFCESIEPMGFGALQIAFEQLKAKLQAEGLFASERKRKIPAMPRHVAVVTSPVGAAIQDILTVLHRRFRGLKVTVVPAVVQGEQATPSVVEAIGLAHKLPDVDVMIVGRGGGSIEDLWAFNTEPVARAIAASRIPVISAVGHEVDFTIADFVADLRAPTPSAAAEMVVKNAAEITESLKQLEGRLNGVIRHTLRLKAQQLDGQNKRLVDPRRKLQDMILRLDEMKTRLDGGIGRFLQTLALKIEVLTRRMGSPHERIQNWKGKVTNITTGLEHQMNNKIHFGRARLAKAAAVLDSVSPLAVVGRGYAIATAAGRVIKSSQDLKIGDALHLRLAAGSVEATVSQIFNDDAIKQKKD